MKVRTITDKISTKTVITMITVQSMAQI